MISPEPIYSHRVYVDFSGDLGNPKVEGSSKTVCIAWVLSSEEDREHNEKVLMDIKKSVGCGPEDEVQYQSLRRHPEKDQALAQLANLKIGVAVVVALKENIRDTNLSGRARAILINSFPWACVAAHLSESTPESVQVCAQLIFDQVAWSDFREELVTDLVRDYKPIVSPDDCIKFLDSPSAPLLQLADIIAGMCQDYIESIDRSDLIPCQVCWAKGWPSHHKRCRKGNLRQNRLLKTMYPMLLKTPEGKVGERGLISRPPEAKDRFMFVDCIKW